MSINFDDLEKSINNPKGNATKAFQILLKQSCINQAKIESIHTLLILHLSQTYPKLFDEHMLNDRSEEYIVTRANNLIDEINAKIID